MINPTTNNPQHSPLEYLAAAQANPSHFPETYVASMQEVSAWCGLSHRAIRYWWLYGVLHEGRPQKAGKRYELAAEQRQRVQQTAAMRARGWRLLDIHNALNAPTAEARAAAYELGEQKARELRQGVFALASMLAAADDALKQGAAA